MSVAKIGIGEDEQNQFKFINKLLNKSNIDQEFNIIEKLEWEAMLKEKCVFHSMMKDYYENFFMPRYNQQRLLEGLKSHKAEEAPSKKKVRVL